ncbi:hypothetical protein ACN70_09590 [Escherichia coli]|nr:hypothetical protein ACN70_09590 [Escherichia coli]
MKNLYRSVSQITRDKFERTMPQAYCCRAYKFSGKECHVYAKFIIRCAVSRLEGTHEQAALMAGGAGHRGRHC